MAPSASTSGGSSGPPRLQSVDDVIQLAVQVASSANPNHHDVATILVPALEKLMSLKGGYEVLLQASAGGQDPLSLLDPKTHSVAYLYILSVGGGWSERCPKRWKADAHSDHVAIAAPLVCRSKPLTPHQSPPLRHPLRRPPAPVSPPLHGTSMHARSPLAVAAAAPLASSSQSSLVPSIWLCARAFLMPGQRGSASEASRTNWRPPYRAP